MALNTEIWANALVENLYADDTFAARAVNHSAYANNKTVHVPNAGTPPTVTIDGTQFPATAAKRTDADLSYDLSVFRTAPVVVQNAEEVELSYDKRNSVLLNARLALTQAVHNSLLTSWVGSVDTSAKVTKATMDKSTVLAVKNIFDQKDIPQQGRCMIMTPAAYNELLADLSAAEQFAFSASADSARGTVGTLFGFDIYMRSTIDTTTSNKTSALAWHQDCVSRALGNVGIFEAQKDPQWYGDIISAEIRAGGKGIRYDKAGLALVKTA